MPRVTTSTTTRAPAPMRPQDEHNANAIARATAFTAHIRHLGHNQTLTHREMMGAGMLALIMHRDCVATGCQALPNVYAITPEGTGTLVPPLDWLPPVLEELGTRSAGTYEPHPAIAAHLAALKSTATRLAAKGGPAMVAQPVQQQQARARTVFTFTRWRHGGWYVNEVRHPSGAIGCVSNNYADKRWRIVCDPRPVAERQTYASRHEAAQAEFDLTNAQRAANR